MSTKKKDRKNYKYSGVDIRQDLKRAVRIEAAKKDESLARFAGYLIELGLEAYKAEEHLDLSAGAAEETAAGLVSLQAEAGGAAP